MNPSLLDSVIKIVKELGFPIAVVIWLFYERYGIINELITAINKMMPLLEKMADK